MYVYVYVHSYLLIFSRALRRFNVCQNEFIHIHIDVLCVYMLLFICLFISLCVRTNCVTFSLEMD